MAIIKGKVIEKGGVNISTVGGQFSESMRSRILVLKRIQIIGLQELAL